MNNFSNSFYNNKWNEKVFSQYSMIIKIIHILAINVQLGFTAINQIYTFW